MGCQCAKSTEPQDNNEIKTTCNRCDGKKMRLGNPLTNNRQIAIDNSSTSMNNSRSTKKNDNIDYKERALELINQIRKDPASFADIIQKSIQYIKGNEDIITFTKNNISVKLSKGESAFLEAEEKLRMMESLPPLKFNGDICIPLPENEEQIKNKECIKQKAKEAAQSSQIEVYFQDLTKDPEISILMMIVDDNGKNSGRKRASLLNPNYKYIGINHRFINKSFIAYFSFSS